MILLIELKNISFCYPKSKKNILSDYCLKIDEGECIAFMGDNGAGKSTLLKILAGLLLPYQGEYLFESKVLGFTYQEMSVFRKENIGVMPQRVLLLPDRNGWNNVMLPLFIANVSKKECYTRIESLAEEINAYHLLDLFPNEMSGGERQIVAFMRSVITTPKLLLMDEVTTFLDDEHTRKIIEHINKMCKVGSTALIVTHDEDIANACKYVQHIPFCT